MASTIELSPSWTTLTETIRRVRGRWRLRVALHGITIVAAAALLLIVGGAWVMNELHFSTWAIITLRVVAYATLIALAVRYIVIPLRRPITDAQIALYLEEHAPSLDTVVVSALDAGASDAPAFVRSPHLISKVVDSAAVKVREVDDGAHIESRSIKTSLSALAAMAIALVLLIAIGPEFLRTGAHLLAAPTSNAHGKVFISVTPENAEVSRGGNQAIRAQLHGFNPDRAEIVTQRGSGPWQRFPMTALRDSGIFTVRLFDVRERTSYYVESEGIRSPTYHLDVVDLPFVKTLTLDLHYPSYTGIPDTTITQGGDIAVPRGTTVQVHATTTMPVNGAWLVVDGHPRIPMTRSVDGVLSAAMTVNANGFYKIELATPGGNTVPGSLTYTIDMLEDGAPTITFLKPGRDVSVDSLAEVFTQIEATDDYGVAKVDLRYAINGGEEQVASLHSGTARKDVIAGYTYFVKSLNLKPGDVISYYAEATDNDAPEGGQTTKTDIYFVNVRPHYHYKKSDKKGQQQQQQNQPSPGELVRKQRQIVAGSFKVDRDRARMTPQALAENTTTLLLAQTQLHSQVEQLGNQIMSRGLAASDTMFQMILDELNGAIKEMKAAEGPLASRDVRTALGPEQRALQHLQRAESANREREVSQSKDANDQEQEEDPSKELADLFQLDKNQLNDQHETQRATPKPKAVDSLAQKLKELAQRQQREEELRRQAQQQQAQGQQRQPNDGGEGQRQIARETEQTAQRMEQMSQMTEDGESFRQSAQQLREAAKDMRRAASSQKTEDAAKAASKLDAVQEKLAERSQSVSGKSGADPKKQLLDRAHELMRTAQSLQDRLRDGQAGRQEARQNPSGQSPSQQQQQQQQSQQQGQQPGQPQGQQQGQQKGQQPGAGKDAQQRSDQPSQGRSDSRARPQQPGNGEQYGENSEPSGNPDGRSQRRRATSEGGFAGGASDIDLRQVAQEFRAQRQSAEALQRDVQRQGGDARGLNQVISDMRRLEAQAGGDNVSPNLQSEVVDGLKEWEFAFRRRIEGGDRLRPVLGSNGDVPADYKALVEEYYKALAEEK